jgi:hypothetical protein
MFVLFNRKKQKTKFMHWIKACIPQILYNRCASVSTGNTFQDLPRLRETPDNTERYIYNVIFV